jgi:hypothetical protein
MARNLARYGVAQMDHKRPKYVEPVLVLRLGPVGRKILAELVTEYEQTPEKIIELALYEKLIDVARSKARGLRETARKLNPSLAKNHLRLVK